MSGFHPVDRSSNLLGDTFFIVGFNMEKVRRRRRNIEKEIQEVIDSPLILTSDSPKANRKNLLKKNILSSGDSILNLACTNNINGFLLKGKYYLFVGESESGKTWLTMNLFAESTLHPVFKNYKLIYDNVEDGANMDLEFYFGSKTAKRIEVPEPDRKDKNGIPEPYSITIEQFYDSIDRHLDLAEEGGYGIIYIGDSMDGLTSEAELKKAKINRVLRVKRKDTEGEMGDGKAKINSKNLRRICSRLAKSGSILVIVAQEREIIGGMGGKSQSGGKAMKFYATLQLWARVKKLITCNIRGKERTLGVLSEINIRKNRLTGEKHKRIYLPIYHSFGVDRLGSMVDWLMSEDYWEGGKTEVSKIKAINFDVELNKESLIRHIEKNDLEDKLKEIVNDLWNEIQKKIINKVVRERRYL